MAIERAIRARLIVELPSDRYTVKATVGRTPSVGDVVHLDQAFTNADGAAMVLGYCFSDSGETLYEAEIYESELGPNLPSEET